jgi:succinoglycan biosynthesis transport protein ExoP
MMQQPTATPPSLNLGDIYYVLFRHKWKILICSLAGLAVAVILYRLDPPMYQSEAKLLVRYIISENKMIGPNPDSAATSSIPTDQRGATIMATETEILKSIDLAMEVARAIGPEKILALEGGGQDLGLAVASLRRGLRVNVPPGSAVIQISFRHQAREIVQPVLREILDQYLLLHVAAHRASGMLGDSLAAEADTLRSRLAQTEDDLRRTTSKAGIISLEDAKAAYSAQTMAIRRAILDHEAELAGRLAVLEGIRKREASAGESVETNQPQAEIPTSALEAHGNLSMRYSRLREMEQGLLLQFTAENLRVKQVQAQLADVNAELQTLREKYPRLAGMTTQSSATLGPDPLAEEATSAWIHVTEHQAKIKELTAQLERLRAEAAKLESVEGPILELRRKKELDEANYRYYAANLEQARINETLGNGKVSNISQIQAPSPAFREMAEVKPSVLSLLGGIFAGLAWAFLIELFLDRSIRRPSDLARIARVPLFLSIPRLRIESSASKPGGAKPLELNAPANSSVSIVRSNTSRLSEASAEALLPFHETLRDRLIGYFENRNLTHKPKLVAVTGLLDNAGVTTTAMGLARSLSETGEGSVLLVDMTAGQGSAQQFMRGKPVCGIDDLLEAPSAAHVQENLYVVGEANGSDRLSRNLPKRFASLVPKLKASDFD